MKPKKKTSPKIVPIIPPIIGAIAGVAGRKAARGAVKKTVQFINKRKATGIKDAKGLTKMKKALGNQKLSGTQNGRPMTYTGPVQSKNVRKIVKKK